MERVKGLVFGTAGVPLSAKERTTEAGIERIAELGLGCMEVEFVQGVRMGEPSARLVGGVAAKLGVRLSAHGPYFINFNAREVEKVVASQQRLLKAARISSICGAESVVFHAAFYLGESPSTVYATVKKNLEEVMAQLRAEGIRAWLRPEVMGKGTEFGTLDEVLRLSAEVEGMAPCIDFAHLHARTGEFNSYPEFMAILRQTEEKLGRGSLDDMHIHVSGVDYGEKGERKHLILEESDFRYIELLRALKDCGAKGLVICESPSLEEDALLLQKEYEALAQERR